MEWWSDGVAVQCSGARFARFNSVKVPNRRIHLELRQTFLILKKRGLSAPCVVCWRTCWFDLLSFLPR